MQALLFLSFVALSFGVWTEIPEAQRNYLVDHINWYRDGFQWDATAADKPGNVVWDSQYDISDTCDDAIEVDGDDDTYFEAAHWDVEGTPYDNFEEFVDYFLNPEWIDDCTAGNPLALDNDLEPEWISVPYGVLFGWFLSADTETVSCWEGCGNSVMCVFLDGVDGDGVDTIALELTSCPDCGDDLRFLSEEETGYVWEGCDAATAVEGCDMTTCQVKDGYTCDDEANAWVTADCMPVCGDGMIIDDDSEDPEECDTNGVAVTGCTSMCQVRVGYTCSNNNAGVTTTCTIIPGWTCGANNDVDCTTTCGDSLAVSDQEECDDGNNVAAVDGCNSSCEVVDGWGCQVTYDRASTKSVCAPICGDGTVAGSEECDDGNTSDEDGCDNECMITGEDDDVECSGLPSNCAPADWESPIDDSDLNGWITPASLTAFKVWAESTSGPALITAAAFTHPTSASNVVVGAFTFTTPASQVNFNYGNIRSDLEQMRAYIGDTYYQSCKDDVNAGEIEEVSEDDCDYVDALVQSVWSEIYPQNTGMKVEFDPTFPVSATFRVVSRYYSSANTVVSGFAFLVAALVAAFH